MKLISALSIALLFSLSVIAEGVKDQNLNIEFPDKIGSLKFQSKHQYDEPGLGYSLRYQDDQLFKVDIYIYDKGRSDIGTGINTTPVKKEFEAVLQVFPLMEERGQYSDVTKIKKGITSTKNGAQFRWARFKYKQTAAKNVSYTGWRISDTYLVAKSGQLVKVRLTLKEDDFTKRKAEITKFIDHLARILK
jgi:hypothetical protein